MMILIKNGKILDPAGGINKKASILVKDGIVAQISAEIKGKPSTIIDAKGCFVVPGLIDMHAHLREPGREDKETIETGLLAAASGGFTSVCAMPNTEPACDGEANVRFLLDKAREAKLSNLLPVGTITKGRKGEELTEMAELKKAGCLAVSDDGDSVRNAELMRRALEYAAMVDLLVISHCEDKALAAGGVMNEGYCSTVLGMKPIPAEAETTMVERDIRLAELAGARLHIAHVSAKESVEAIRLAKKRGVKVTAEVTPHHFSLTEEDVRGFDTNTKVNPPLRSADDVSAIKKALKDGTIDVIATDHAPHLDNEKEREYDYAPFGMIGLETALSLSVMNLVNEGYLDWEGLIGKLAANPAKILKYQRGTLTEGSPADITIIDPEAEWVYTTERIRSLSRNSPFVGETMKAAVTDVIVGGRVVIRGGAPA